MFVSKLPIGFFGAAAVSGAVSCMFKPMSTAIWIASGAIQGAIGAYVLTTLGYGGYSIAIAATVGALAGAAIAAPVALLIGLKGVMGLFQEQDRDRDQGVAVSLIGFTLRMGIIFLASLVVSTALFLGTQPAVAVASGALVTEAASFVIS